MNTSPATITLAALGTLGIMLAGCSGPVAGTAQPGKPATSVSAPPSGNPFAARNQCALLDQILAGQGFPKATPSIADEKRACASQKPSTGTTSSIDVAIALQDGQLYTDNILRPDTARRGDINGRPSIEQPSPQNTTGQCQVGMAVEPRSRALVLVSSDLSTAEACAQAEKYATALEPLLPKG
ncbi:DUF3558 family protein [Amycolatopsis benzoatilytica]|uniref:DUF3558 family protein n=1 Tax=Amycolatopsis benzoatilytica TaxID=346045 RepID=UPI000A06CA38|nr:DUF3558 family protein [Amycolatopsis benzoatilytica]